MSCQDVEHIDTDQRYSRYMMNSAAAGAAPCQSAGPSSPVPLVVPLVKNKAAEDSKVLKQC